MTSSHQRVLGAFTVITLLAIIGLWHRAYQTDQEPKVIQAAPHNPTPVAATQFLTPDKVPTLSLNQALAGESSINLSQLDPNKLRTIVVTGDIIPARGVDAKIRQYGANYPFAGNGITDFLQSGELTIANLEAPLLDSCPQHNEGFTFCGQAAFASAMSAAGIDIATLENNHINNYGQTGKDETITHLETAGINYATANRISITDIRNLKVGVLAFNGIGGRFYPESIKERITEARAQVDLLFVAFHWGKEYEMLPTADPKIAPDNPRDIARLAINSGADMVIGNHPHWVQGIEFIENKLVSYAYGNFIFDQSWSVETMQGYIGRYTFYNTNLVKVDIQPVEIKSQSQPNFPPADVEKAIHNRIEQSSYKLSDPNQ